MEFPGDDSPGLPIAGVSWGDTYKFVSVVPGTTDESTLLASWNGWRYDEPNSIPYVLAWATDIDAEQGTVATSPIWFQDHGSDPREWPVTGFGKGQQDLDGPLPLDDDWAYQLMNYPDVPSGGTTDKKIAWGTDVGSLGGFDNWWPAGGWNLQEYSLHRDSTTPWSGSREHGLLLAYSTFVVFGTHDGGYLDGATGRVVREMGERPARRPRRRRRRRARAGPARRRIGRRRDRHLLAGGLQPRLCHLGGRRRRERRRLHPRGRRRVPARKPRLRRARLHQRRAARVARARRRARRRRRRLLRDPRGGEPAPLADRAADGG
jgi:hypothetical protein